MFFLLGWNICVLRFGVSLGVFLPGMDRLYPLFGGYIILLGVLSSGDGRIMSPGSVNLAVGSPPGVEGGPFASAG